MNLEESKTRSIVKAIILRVIIFILTSIYILLINNGTFATCIELSVLDVCVELVTHYIYERVWQKIHWGKIKKN